MNVICGSWLVLACLCALSALAQEPARAANGISQSLLAQTEALRYGEDPDQSQLLMPVALVAGLYERQGFQPFWTQPDAAGKMVRAIEGAHAEGLEPAEFHLREIRELAGRQVLSGAEAARLDLLLSDALFALAYQYRFGKVDPRDVNPEWNISREIEASDPGELLRQASLAGPGAVLEGYTPRHRMYARLREALARYRELARQGGWEPVPAGPSLRIGQLDDRVAALRRRLAVTGELPGSPAEGEQLFDVELQLAVKAFQERHGLNPDGVVGKRTLHHLNVPVSQRIDQLRLSMERGRWLFDRADPDALFVNVAGFRLFLLRGDQVAWSTRVMVGERYRQTPLFRGNMTYLEVNPTWTVPYSIATSSLLPEIRKDPGYLQRKNMLVLDRAGNSLDPSGIDWQAISPRNFPYTLRQMPGPENALGQIKFMFPNEHAVYLHDTPQRYLFASESRAFSAGCIRVEHPFELAGLLFPQGAQWDRERLEELARSGVRRTVRLEPPLSVYIAYFTALVDDQGNVNFWEDIYHRDPQLAEALSRPFRAAKLIDARVKELFGD